MIKTLGGKLVRLFAVAISVVVLTGCALMFTACESSFPEISVRISFNGEEYTLNYKLYRDYYRQTVDHYMALIDADFFDNTVIHDYRSDRMVGGGFGGARHLPFGRLRGRGRGTVRDRLALNFRHDCRVVDRTGGRGGQV